MDIEKYNFVKIPSTDTWGVIMRKDSPLAAKTTITPLDLIGVPLICTRQSIHTDISEWFGVNYKDANIIAIYELLYNASVMVKQGIGYNKIVNTGSDS